MENITGVITAIRKKSNQKKENKNLKKETSPYGESKKKISLSLSRTPEERMQEFYESMVPYASQYDREMLNDFYQYWTELDKRRRRMRFEMQKTWEIGKRLACWWAPHELSLVKGHPDSNQEAAHHPLHA